jgi:hypothetical protein
LYATLPQTAAQAASGIGFAYRIVFAQGICIAGILLLETG